MLNFSPRFVVVALGFAFAWTAEAAVATCAVRVSLHQLVIQTIRNG